jgi:dihydroorotase
MEAHNLVLNLHGEVPNTSPPAFVNADGTDTVTVLNAETMFLPMLYKLHAAFPLLRIVLERERERREKSTVPRVRHWMLYVHVGQLLQQPLQRTIYG